MVEGPSVPVAELEYCKNVRRTNQSFHPKTQTFLILWACLAFIQFTSIGFALEPNQPLSQLYRTSWNARDGLTGSVLALAQSIDGYLWVGTTDGLFRFDGISFERYKPGAGSFAASSVSSLLALSDGGLWIGYLRGGASFLKDGHVTNYAERDGFPLATVRAFAQDWDGNIWAAAVGGFTRLEGRRWQKVRAAWNYPDKAPTAMFVDNQGTLWVADTHVIMFLPRGDKKFHDTGIRVDFRVTSFAQLPDGAMWLEDGTHHVLKPLPPVVNRTIASRPRTGNTSDAVLVDRDGALWLAGQSVGLIREPFPKWSPNMQVATVRPGMEVLGEKQGLPGLSFTVLEDREGNIWVGTEGGLERFRYRNLTWRPLPVGSHSFSLVAGDHGDVWAGTGDGSVLRVQDNKLIKDGPQDTLVAYRDSENTIWFSTPDTFWKWQRGEFIKVAPPDQVKEALTLSKQKDPVLITSIARDHSGSIWTSIAGFGEFELKTSGWKFAEVLKEDPDWAARSAFADSRDRLWLVFGDIVAVLDRGEVQVFSAKEGLTVGPPNIVGGLDEQVYVGGESGVAVLQGSRFRALTPAGGNDFGLITGIVATHHDGLWLAAGPGIVHIPEREIQTALQRPDYRVAYELFDLVSDLPEPLQRPGALLYSPGAIQSMDGMIWFATRSGAARVDPAHITRNPLPPPVSIRAAIADNKSYPVEAKASLPPLTKSLEIDYTALSLSIPERVRFRYKLEGVDENWQDVGTRREAFFRDLPPGKYGFHVIACNNDGVWNETGAAFDFMIAPAWYQTLWFKLSMVSIGLAVACLLFLIERQRYAALLRVRYDERLEERTRLARDLHDTLLQTIHGTKLVADFALDSLDDPPKARSAIERVSQWLERATVEGRAALDSLRNSTMDPEDLLSALRKVAEAGAPASMRLTFSVSGSPRSMHPVARGEVFRIGEEAIRNACVHSGGESLSVAVRYGRNLILQVQDSGRWVDRRVLTSGKPGHFGIMGMRERASNIGGRLSLEPSGSGGTSVTLTVPGRVIYETGTIGSLVRALRWTRSGQTRSDRDKANQSKADQD